MWYRRVRAAAKRRKTVKELLLHTRVRTILPDREDVHIPRTGCVFPLRTYSERVELDAKLSLQKCLPFTTQARVADAGPQIGP